MEHPTREVETPFLAPFIVPFMCASLCGSLCGSCPAYSSSSSASRWFPGNPQERAAYGWPFCSLVHSWLWWLYHPLHNPHSLLCRRKCFPLLSSDLPGHGPPPAVLARQSITLSTDSATKKSRKPYGPALVDSDSDLPVTHHGELPPSRRFCGQYPAPAVK